MSLDDVEALLALVAKSSAAFDEEESYSPSTFPLTTPS
jgi:hypothetical protein